MKLNANKLASAVRLAMTFGTVATVGAFGVAQAQTAPDSSGDKKTLDTISVTGSNIRRVETETANPVITIDRAQIEKTGAATLGTLLQDIPAMSGSMASPNINNGGGDGASTLSLRGLGPNRTLVLINGHRIMQAGGQQGPDINTIPATLVDHIEVLTDGASAIYGSDAVGGVVNFIMRQNYQGAELTVGYGESDYDDGARKNWTLTFGQTSDRGSILGSIDYNKNAAILGNQRPWGVTGLNLGANGVVTPAGSLTSPGGIYTGPAFASCTNNPYGAATFDTKAAGGNGLPAGFRCYNMPSGNSMGDEYNFAAVNYVATPAERTSVSLFGDYKLTDSVQAYMSVMSNRTNANSQLAPMPIDLAGDGITMAAGNPYNPLGVDVGAASTVGNDASIRALSLGPRRGYNSTTTDNIVAGLKGSILDTSWQWDGYLNYGHYSQTSIFAGLPNLGAMATAMGANCTMPAAGVELSTSTCLNFFNQYDPNTQALMQQFYSQSVYTHTLYTQREAALNVNGTLFSLPAGDVSLAFGGDYRKLYADITGETDAIEDVNGQCNVPLSGCFAPYAGGYSVKEVYAETLIPLVKDLPFVKSLTLELGDRYSQYNSFGSTNNWQAQLEYRPIDDLLLRGTVATVFRAPNISEMYTPLVSSYDNYSETNGYISKNGSQIITQFAGAALQGFPIQPEQGKSFSFGFVYDPHWIEGLSFSADTYRIYLNDVIMRPQGQALVALCLGPNPSAAICGPIQFNYSQPGVINTITNVSYENLGRLDVSGADLGVHYKLPTTPFGDFRLNFTATYTSTYNIATQGGDTIYAAGTLNAGGQEGLLPRWRALGSLDWSLGNFSAHWQSHFLNRTSVEGLPSPLTIGAWTQNDVSFAYNIQPINTLVSVGIDNVGNKMPPYVYQEDISNMVEQTDYNTIGRFYWARATIKF